jgi:fatty-acyl-CoA synthase
MRNGTPSNVSADWLRALERTARAVQVPDRIFGLVIDELAEVHGNRTALVGEKITFTYAELAARTNRYARWALANGVKMGKCVALLMPNSPEYIAIWSGISRVGGVVALINVNLRGQALANCLNTVSPLHLIVASDLVDAYHSATSFLHHPSTLWVHAHSAEGNSPLCQTIEAMAPGPLEPAETRAVSLSDRALYIFTSGTTGLPKAANVSHRRVVEWSYWFAGLMDTRTDDRMYNCLPLYHSIGGVAAIGSVLVSGGSVVIRDKFSASRFWNDVTKTECTLFQYIGELCRYLVNAPPSQNETSHRLRICCGNGLRADVWQQFKVRFKIPRIIEFYAATEGTFSLYNVEGKPGAIGRLPGFMTHRSPVAIVKFDFQSGSPVRNDHGFCIRCAVDEPGEAIGRLTPDEGKGAARFEGYTSNAENTRKILHNVFSAEDAWFRTGDLMKVDKMGYFYFVDRIGDTFRWKGENVSTIEVENVIVSCPGVKEAMVYGVAVPGFDGSAGMAAVVIDDNFDPATLYAFVSEHLPYYARPLFIRIANELAKNETFKQNKQKLKYEGFDTSLFGDAVLVEDQEKGTYIPTTVQSLAQMDQPSPPRKDASR